MPGTVVYTYIWYTVTGLLDPEVKISMGDSGRPHHKSEKEQLGHSLNRFGGTKNGHL